MQIAAVEDAMIAKITAALPKPVLLAVESLPADFDNETLLRVLRLAPGAFVVFDGGSSTGNTTIPGIRAQFSAIAVTKHASGEKARRRGDSQQIGAYEIIETLVPQLHRLNVPDVGSLSFTGIENRFDGQLDKQGVAVYAATFTIDLAFDPVPFESLQPFNTANLTLSKPSSDENPASVDVVTVPQT